MNTIGAGIIGYGASAQTFHRPFIDICDGIALRAVLTSKAQSAIGGDVAAEHDLSAFLKRSDVDVVIITAPNSEHFRLARAALEAGKHVVVEKPMVTRFTDALALKALAETQSRLLTIFHNRRLDGDFLTIQSLVDSGELGHIRVMHSRWDRYRPVVRQRWRELPGDGSGIWYDLGPHLLDQALCLFGAPQAITAHCRALRGENETCDYFSATLHYPDREVLLGSSPYCAAPTFRFQLEGTRATYRKWGLDNQEAQLKAGMSPLDTQFGTEDAKDYGIIYAADGGQSILPTKRGRFIAYYPDLVAAIRNHSAPAVGLDEALMVMQLLELGIQSSAQNQTLAVPPMGK